MTEELFKFPSSEKKIAQIISRLKADKIEFGEYHLKKSSSGDPGSNFLHFVFTGDDEGRKKYEKTRNWFAGHQEEFKITTGSTLASELTILVLSV